MIEHQAQEYLNPLSRATRPIKGRVAGARIKTHRPVDLGAEGDWCRISPGESRDVAPKTVVQVQGPAGRMQSFWFEESGSVHGPLFLASFTGADAKSAFDRATRRANSVVLALICGVTAAFLLIFFGIASDWSLWSASAKWELAGTLLMGWAVSVLVVLQSHRPAQRVKRQVIEISTPKSRIE